MTSDELREQFFRARLDYAKSVVDFHRCGCNDDALLDRMSECELAFISAMFDSIETKAKQALQLFWEPVECFGDNITVEPFGPAEWLPYSKVQLAYPPSRMAIRGIS